MAFAVIGDLVSHPDDEWIDVTSLGSAEPVVILGRSGADIEIAKAKAEYVQGFISLEQFEAAVDRVVAVANVR